MFWGYNESACGEAEDAVSLHPVRHAGHVPIAPKRGFGELRVQKFISGRTGWSVRREYLSQSPAGGRSDEQRGRLEGVERHQEWK